MVALDVFLALATNIYGCYVLDNPGSSPIPLVILGAATEVCFFVGIRKFVLPSSSRSEYRVLAFPNMQFYHVVGVTIHRIVFSGWAFLTWGLVAVRLAATSISWFVVAIPFNIYVIAVPDIKLQHGRISRRDQWWNVALHTTTALLACISGNLCMWKAERDSPSLALCFIPLFLVLSILLCCAAVGIYKAASYSTSLVEIDGPAPKVTVGHSSHCCHKPRAVLP